MSDPFQTATGSLRIRLWPGRVGPATALLILACLLPGMPRIAKAQRPLKILELEEKVQKVVEQTRRCTVAVGSSGSGVVVSKDGLILTCAHVAKETGRKIQVGFPDGRVVSATTLGLYRTADAGLIRIDDPGEYPFAEMAKSSGANVGDWVLATGFAVTFSKRQLPPIRIGRILQSSRNSLISDAPIMGGDSGGPLFNLSGQVIGISSRVSQKIASNVHVPIGQYRRNWKRLLASEDWPNEGPTPRKSNVPSRPPRKKPTKAKPARTEPPVALLRTLGFELKQTDKGAKVMSLRNGSPGQLSGLQVGHIFVSVGKQKVKDIEGCVRELQKHKSSKQVPVTVMRDAVEHAKITMPLRLRKEVVK